MWNHTYFHPGLNLDRNCWMRSLQELTLDVMLPIDRAIESSIHFYHAFYRYLIILCSLLLSLPLLVYVLLPKFPCFLPRGLGSS